MARGWGQRPYTVVAVVLAAGLAGPAHFLPSSGLFMPLVVLLAGAGAAGLTWGYKARGVVGSALSTVAIALFIGGAMFVAVFIRDAPFDDGRFMILFLIAITFATDTGAYLVGKAIGRRKMAPNVSPNKTWEGAAGGLLAAIAVGALFVLGASVLGVVNARAEAIATFAALGAVLGVTGQLGDLFESKLKRRAGLDDSGVIVPGHGGAMDRLDSMTFNLLAFGLVVGAVAVF